MKILVFILSIGLFVGGLVIIGFAFTVPGFQALVFFSGIICIALAFFIPISILPKLDR